MPSLEASLILYTGVRAEKVAARDSGFHAVQVLCIQPEQLAVADHVAAAEITVDC
jgi:hypothetical protein